jgi:hypothetical protein
MECLPFLLILICRPAYGSIFISLQRGNLAIPPGFEPGPSPEYAAPVATCLFGMKDRWLD